MALIMNRVTATSYPHLVQLFKSNVSRTLQLTGPCITQKASLTSTHGEPMKREYKPWPYKKWRYNEFWQFFDFTKKRLDDNSKIIIIDGNIAVGKSWFGEKLAKEFDMKFMEDPKDSNVFTYGDNFDVRTLNEQLPPRSAFCDMETFYSQNGHPDLLKVFGRTQFQMYIENFLRYSDAVEHVLNTGQGVVLERGVYSSMMFFNVFHKLGYLSNSAMKYLQFVFDNTICEMWRPHLVVYLDAPQSFIRTMIDKRNIAWEAKSPVINEEFLNTIDTVYKEKHLPYMGKYGEVISYDMTDLPDWEIIVEELETLDLNSKPEENETKFRDWHHEHDDDYNAMRMEVSKKWVMYRYFHMSVPWEAPELMYHPEDFMIVDNVFHKHPEIEFDKGYNPEKVNVALKIH